MTFFVDLNLETSLQLALPVRLHHPEVNSFFFFFFFNGILVKSMK